MSEVRRLTARLPLRAVEPVGDDSEIEPEVEPAPRSAAAGPGRQKALEEQLPSWLLRAGLAFVLSYAATSSFFRPTTFARYFPSFMPATWATELLPVFAAFEMLLAVGLMTERWTFAASTLAGLTMIAIVVVNPNAFEVLFRNVAIACGAFALAVQSRRRGADRGRRPAPGAADGKG